MFNVLIFNILNNKIMATTKADIMTRNTRFKNFLTAQSKVNNQINIPLSELKTMISDIETWNLRVDVTVDNKITKIAVINGLFGSPTNKVISYLVGVNNADRIIIGGGGTLESPPHYK